MNAPTKIKLALCVALANLPADYRAIYDENGYAAPGANPALLPIPDSFFELNGSALRLEDRATCEEDRSLRQLIPYTTIIDADSKIFVYSRGGEGGEGKLIGKLSIGLGGHVDELPTTGESLLQLLLREGNRELDEEAGLGPEHLNFTHLIADTDPVGCVHAGLLSIRYVTTAEKAALKPEAGCIEKGEWLTLRQLSAPEIFDRLEGWSKLVVTLFIGGDQKIAHSSVYGTVGQVKSTSAEAQAESDAMLAHAQSVIGKTESGAVLQGSTHSFMGQPAGADEDPDQPSDLDIDPAEGQVGAGADLEDEGI